MPQSPREPTADDDTEDVGKHATPDGSPPDFTEVLSAHGLRRTHPRVAVLSVLRPADLLLVRFSFANLQLVRDGDARMLTALVPGRPAALIVDFPPQHLIEEAFPETKPEDTPPDPPPIEASLSANSRLVFNVGSAKIPWSLNGLLDAMTR